MKTITTLLAALLILSISNINAQINVPKNNRVKDIELKKGQYKDLKLITGGNQGYVYQENSIDKKIPNAEIIFTSEDGTSTQKVKTDSYGNYKIRLKPARYVVSIIHKGFRSYSTAPGFSVVNDKFSTLNIPLKKNKKISPFVIVVFDSKTKKIKDHISHKHLKEYKKNDPNSIFIYTTLKTQNGEFIKTLHLNKQFIIRNSSRINPSITPTKTKPFIPNNKFKIGRIIEFGQQKLRVISSTKEEIKLMMIRS